MCDLIASINF